jgi:hypothetical protein
MTQGTHNGQEINFFGTLREIIELEHNFDGISIVCLNVTSLN